MWWRLSRKMPWGDSTNYSETFRYSNSPLSSGPVQWNSCFWLADIRPQGFCGYIHYGSSQAWLTFGHAPLIFGNPMLNSHPFLTSESWRSFHAFADKWLIGLSSNLAGKLIKGLPRLNQLLVTLCWIPAISWLLIADKLLIRLSSNLVNQLITTLSQSD